MPNRFHTDPSGTFIRYEAKAIGSGSEAAQGELQDKWHKVRTPPNHNITERALNDPLTPQFILTS